MLGLMGDSITGGRVTGLSDSMFSKKRKLLQRAPLSVEQLSQLEETLFGDASAADKVAAGFFVFMLFARARYSDALSVASMEIDEVQDGSFGFVGAQASRTKTSITLQKKARLLPMAAQTIGVSGKNWAKAWFEVRESEGLTLGGNIPLLCSPMEGGRWARLPLTVTAATQWLRTLVAGASGPPLQRLGTHSLKSSVLSWMAKHGASHDIRRLLGYHVSAADQGMVTYSRDAMAEPLRQMAGVVREVRERTFMPDASRSGYFPGRDRHAGVANAEMDLSDSSSESSVDEEFQDEGEVERATDEVVGVWEPEDFSIFNESTYFRHAVSRVIHVSRDEAGAELGCGRSITTTYERCPRPKFLRPLCSQCGAYMKRR